MLKPLTTCKCGRTALPGSNRCASHLNDRTESEKNKKADPFYVSQPRKNLRAYFKRQNPFCKCGRPIDVVDHIKAIRDGGDPMALDNLQGQCHTCHNRKHGGRAAA